MPWWIPAAIQATGVVAKAISGLTNKPKPFSNTARGRYLKAVGETGAMSEKARSNIIGQTSKTAGNLASMSRARTRGDLEARGMGSSIAAISSLERPGRQAADTVGRVAADVETRNEMSKDQARREYSIEATGRDDARRSYMSNIVGDTVSGLTGAAGSALGGYYAAAGMQEAKQAAEDATNIEYPPNFSQMSPTEVSSWAISKGLNAKEQLELWKAEILRELQKGSTGTSGTQPVTPPLGRQ